VTAPEAQCPLEALLFEQTQQTSEQAEPANHNRNISHSWHSTAAVRHLGHKMSDSILSAPHSSVCSVSDVWLIHRARCTVHRNVMFVCDLITVFRPGGRSQETGEKYVTRIPIICTLNQILLGSSNRGR
jgi:hypothetical protein